MHREAIKTNFDRFKYMLLSTTARKPYFALYRNYTFKLLTAYLYSYGYNY